MLSKIINTTKICLIIITLNAISTATQPNNFRQIGKVRPIISEVKTANTSIKQVNFNEKLGYIDDNTKIDFYLTYPIIENGNEVDKWVKLPNDRNWSPLSNQTVEVEGVLNSNKLSNIKVVQRSKLSKTHLTNPPTSTGLYKFVTIPLTIQPQTSQTKTNNLTVTAEEIRNVLLDDPKSVNKFYREASYGKFDFTGVNDPRIDVIPVTINATVTKDCQNQIVTEFTQIVQKRLLEQNIDTSNGEVDLGIIIFNDLPQCPPYPFATRGALGERGTPLWLWMPESHFVTGPAIMAHEIGHVLGGNHTAVLRCEDFDDNKTCVVDVDARDRDLMTFGGVHYLMPNNYERLRWGWHPSGTLNDPSVGVIPMFDLYSPILPNIKEGKKRGRFFYKVLSGTYAGGWSVYPESRRNYGRFENYQSDSLAYNLGIAVRIGHGDYGHPEALSLLLDSNDTSHIEDAPLRKNQQVSIGGVDIECIREYMPFTGTRMRVQ